MIESISAFPYSRCSVISPIVSFVIQKKDPVFLDLNRPSRSKVINNFVFEFEYGNVRAVALAVEKLFVIPGWGVSYCDVMWCYDYIWCVMWKRTEFWWLLIIWGVTTIVSIKLVLYYLKVMLLLEHIEQNKYIFNLNLSRAKSRWNPIN